MQMINQKKFTAAILTPNKKIFVVYMAYLRSKMSIHPTLKAQMALLLAKEINVPKEYADFLDIFFKKCTVVSLII